MVSEMERRVRQAIEDLLADDSLVADLETETADYLLAWALECSMKIVMDTGDLEGLSAEEAGYPRLRALRMLMRLVNRWIKTASRLDRAARSTLLNQVLSLASTIYGTDFVRPDETRCNEILDSEPEQSLQVITALRGLLENRLTRGAENATRL